MVTGQLSVDADLFTRLDLRLGNAARHDAHVWFVESCERLGIGRDDLGRLHWNALAKVAATTGVAPDRVGDREFELARTAIVDAYVARGMPASGRNIASIFHRLRLTLFHVGRLDTYRHPSRRPPVSITGSATVAPAFADTARRYVTQVRLSLRPSTVKHIEHDLREFGTWLSGRYPEVATAPTLSGTTSRPTRPGWRPNLDPAPGAVLNAVERGSSGCSAERVGRRSQGPRQRLTVYGPSGWSSLNERWSGSLLYADGPSRCWRESCCWRDTATHSGVCASYAGAGHGQSGWDWPPPARWRRTPSLRRAGHPSPLQSGQVPGCLSIRSDRYLRLGSELR